ncbi:L-threonylcarbamoyladenylate synthase [Thiolinea disciformis]|uniref:L-threonylcarbamoyladenylate synthase n=1 Tax=Thiolinea disciformis TaxID=125614 RepID=UPI00037D5690|nr:Sua5/YciO/YrdC/YwlC family protein [Thiolinea disciformis]
MTIGTDIHAAVAIVQHGGLLAYPTEAVFGLGCDPSNLVAVERLLTLKQRPIEKGLILIASDLSQLDDYLDPIPTELLARIHPTWPGPITWLLPAKTNVSTWLRGEHLGLAVRISAHPTCQILCQKLGHPLISTSANRTTEPAARDAPTVKAYFEDQVDYILDLPTGGRAQPSEIRDALSGKTIRAS